VGLEELAGFALLLTTLIEIGKRLGLIPDGMAGLAAVIADIVLYILVQLVAGYFGVDLTAWDNVARVLAELLAGFFLAVGMHKGFRAANLPLFKQMTSRA